MLRFLKIVATLLIVAPATIYILVLWPLREKHPVVQLARGTVAVRGAIIYISPDQPALANATLVARDGRIAQVGIGE